MEEIDSLTPVVARYLRIDDVTAGDPAKDYIARYRGQLLGDSVEAYDHLVADLQAQELTILFRQEGEQHVIFLLAGAIRPKPSNPAINLVLFILTVFSVLFAGALYVYEGAPNQSTMDVLRSVLGNLSSGIPFAVSMLAILLAHEFGHYLAGRYHRTHVTLPYFIPFPISPFGTMGAFIQMKELPRNRRTLLDIGIAGPLAGVAVAIPVLFYGLSISKVGPIHIPDGGAIQLEGNSLLYLFAKFVVFGRLLPSPASYGGLSPLAYWVRYFFTGQPAPIGGLDVMISPVAWAGWAGLLVTALNLLPVGQLDGGHLIYVLFGRRANWLWPVILVMLVILGFFWSGWWLWAGLVLLFGRFHAEPMDQITRLDGRRKLLAVLGVILFFLVFTPVPLALM
jgi:membrane-associated protease RseP (regulator of RpoE activity)